ncbi:MAG: hypothetical protein ACKOCS_13445 [Microcystis sp.]
MALNWLFGSSRLCVIIHAWSRAKVEPLEMRCQGDPSNEVIVV